MSNRHQRTLESYKDTGSVYSYGYGALREACRLYDEQDLPLEEFREHWHNIVAAVEFRAAEIKADLFAAELVKADNRNRELFKPQPEAVTPIYSSDETRDETREE